MQNVVSLADAKQSAKQALLELALLSMTGAVTSEDAAVLLRLLSAATAGGQTADDGLTLAADQIKVRGAGRRPASLIGREVLVTAAWTVVRENGDGRVTVALAGGPSPTAARKAVRRARKTRKA
jgi:hypothetical protein